MIERPSGTMKIKESFIDSTVEISRKERWAVEELIQEAYDLGKLSELSKHYVCGRRLIDLKKKAWRHTQTLVFKVLAGETVVGILE